MVLSNMKFTKVFIRNLGLGFSEPLLSAIPRLGKQAQENHQFSPVILITLVEFFETFYI